MFKDEKCTPNVKNGGSLMFENQKYALKIKEATKDIINGWKIV